MKKFKRYRLLFQQEFEKQILDLTKTGTIRRFKQDFKVGDIVAGIYGIFTEYDKAPFYIKVTEERKVTILEAYNSGLMRRACSTPGWYFDRYKDAMGWETEVWFYGFELYPAKMSGYSNDSVNTCVDNEPGEHTNGSKPFALWNEENYNI